MWKFIQQKLSKLGCLALIALLALVVTAITKIVLGWFDYDESSADALSSQIGEYVGKGVLGLVVLVGFIVGGKQLMTELRGRRRSPPPLPAGPPPLPHPGSCSIPLSQNHPPTAEYAPNFAADIIEFVGGRFGVVLDYSVASLNEVDHLIEAMRQDGCTESQVSGTLFGLGCYVGEVFVRHAGGTWRNAAEMSMAGISGFPLVVQLGAEHFCNPIGKVFKRLHNGKEDYLPHFYEVFSKQSLRDG